MNKLILLSVFFFIITNLTAQTDTTFNVFDSKGLKQGYWRLVDAKGKIKYSGYFVNDKPVGLMKRYYDDNSLKAEMYFDSKSVKAFAKLYFQKGTLTAEGNYIDSKKDSIWNYYSALTNKLSRKENYALGVLNGSSISFYPDGKVLEEREWKNGMPDNKWIQYYPNGVVKMTTTFKDGKRIGDFKTNYPSDSAEWRGQYVNDLPDGNWVEYDTKGKVVKTIKYKNGIALNAEQLEMEDKEFFKKIDAQKGKIAEPDEINFFQKKKNEKKENE